jgi:hypothetical protein
MKTQKEVRAAFWATFPNLSKKRHRYSWNQNDKTAELVYSVDTRCTFVDFVDQLQSNGQISEALANRVTL